MDDEELSTQSIDKLVKRYSMLFVLPSYKQILSMLAFLCVSGGILSAFSLPSVINGVFLGFSLLFFNLISDYLVAHIILRGDPIYNLRRTLALSFFCWILLFFFIFLGSAISILYDFSLGINFYLLGFSSILILRLLVFICTSSKSRGRSILTTVLQPFFCIIPFLFFWPSIHYLRILLFLIYSLGISLLSVFTFLYLLNNLGRRIVGFPSLPLFKTFLVNWITGLNAPFESFLEKVGKIQDVELSLMKFDAITPQTVVVVPTIHPGPFKNVGSSLLPSMLKTKIEQELDCVACVPHGLLSHELDLASQAQNQRVIHHAINSLKFEPPETKATPFIQTTHKMAKVGCQIFGRSALVSLTLAPQTTEDLPQALGEFVHKEAEKNGISQCAIINAHNSLNGAANVEDALFALKEAASNCLEKAASLKRFPFEVGAATLQPESFSLKDGMGPGGITSIVVKVADQKSVYIVIDGNNMISGLREKILSSLKSMGLDEGEVLTTDTHSVNALILTERGYHPIGESMDHEVLIRYIREVTLEALSNMKSVTVGTRIITVPNVKVIGEKMLQSFSLLAERTIQRAKKIIFPIFGTAGLLLMLFLTYL